MDVSIQNGSLTATQTLPALRADELMAVIKQIDSGDGVWYKFRRAFANEHRRTIGGELKDIAKVAKELLRSKGLSIVEVIFDSRKKADGVLPEQVPKFIKIVCRQDKAMALRSLQELDLKETLVARGLQEADAAKLIKDEVKSLTENPEDQAILEKLSSVFGASVAGVRYMRTPTKDGQGTVLVFAAIDLVMMAKGCNYGVSKNIIQRIFKDYYEVDFSLEESAVSGESSLSSNNTSQGANCSLSGSNGNQSIIQNVYHVRLFVGERGGGQKTLALDVQGAAELLCLIPGSDFSAQMRRRAVDVLLRVEGGDESLIDRIQANRKFQNFLAKTDPNHPLRAIGEYAETRQAEEADNERKRKVDLEAAIDLEHKKRMLKLDEQLKLQDLEVKKAETDAKKAEAEKLHTIAHETWLREQVSTTVVAFEALNRLGIDLSPRTRRLGLDKIRTALVSRERSDGELGKPVFLSKILEKELHLTPVAAMNRATAFGKKVKVRVSQHFPDYQISTTNRTVHGSDREINQYYEKHMPAIYEALEDYKTTMSLVRDEELSPSARGQARRSAQSSLLNFEAASSSQALAG